MILGYVIDSGLLRDDILYESQKKKFQADMIYADRHGEKTAQHDMIKYARPGDVIISQSALELCDTAGDFIELALDLLGKNVYLICKDEKIETSMAHWKFIAESLSAYGSREDKTTRGRIPRIVEDLETCFELVAKKEMTVKDVCQKLNISKSMYYRRWRQTHTFQPRENHMELFDTYEELVKKGEITVTEACRQMNISISTYYRKCNRQ